tara:strand:+ start:247 stop:393 length:147 start_codon:yes stop_codon:yes gene_type:complete
MPSGKVESVPTTNMNKSTPDPSKGKTAFSKPDTVNDKESDSGGGYTTI